MGVAKSQTQLSTCTRTHTSHTHINYINILFSLKKKKKDLKLINQTGKSGVRVVDQMELSLSALDISVLLTFPF